MFDCPVGSLETGVVNDIRSSPHFDAKLWPQDAEEPGLGDLSPPSAIGLAVREGRAELPLGSSGAGGEASAPGEMVLRLRLARGPRGPRGCI